ncbi:hypothetical protein VNO77_24893 [Canavalia gladiata]|uniref:Uncharacterized protein n=1 Tax=Canavalia gladiata TaxID=3824 RepID=A0AAN9QAE5_CANGL
MYCISVPQVNVLVQSINVCASLRRLGDAVADGFNSVEFGLCISYDGLYLGLKYSVERDNFPLKLYSTKKGSGSQQPKSIRIWRLTSKAISRDFVHFPVQPTTGLPLVPECAFLSFGNTFLRSSTMPLGSGCQVYAYYVMYPYFASTDV